MQANVSIGVLVVSVAMLSVVLVLLCVRMYRSRRISGWTPLSGTVLRRQVEKQTHCDSGDYYELEVEVSYEWNEVIYSSSTIYFDKTPQFRNIKKAEAFMPELQVGSLVSIYANPMKPSEAVISTRTHPIQSLVGIVVTAYFLYQIGKMLIAALYAYPDPI
jgi:hypothetical protein